MASRPHPFSRAASALAALALALTVPMSALAGTADDPEIVDGAGDASASTALMLQAETGQNAASGMVDIVKTYVTGENRDGFAIVFQVDDLPDEWNIGHGQPGSPLPGTPGAMDADWAQVRFDAQLALTAFFTIDDAPYRVVVQLAEVQVNSPEHVEAYLATLRDAALEDARAHLGTAQALLEASPLPAEARGPAVRAIDTAEGAIDDVPRDDAEAIVAVMDLVQYAKHLATRPEVPAAVQQELDQAREDLGRALQTIGIDAGQVQQEIEESAQELWDELEGAQDRLEALIPSLGDPDQTVADALKEIQDQLERAGVTGLTALVQELADQEIGKAVAFIQFVLDTLLGDEAPTVPTSAPGIPTGGLGFALVPGQSPDPAPNIDEAVRLLEDLQTWVSTLAPEEIAAPELAAPLPPSVVVFQKYTLYHEDGNVSLSGAIDLDQDRIQVHVPKGAVGSPAAGDRLTHFRSQSTVADVVADYAPDAAMFDATQAPGSVIGRAASGEFLVATFGRDYTFQYRPPAAAGGSQPVAGGDDPPATGPFRVAALGEQTAAIEPGGRVSYAVRIENPGAVVSRGMLFLNTASPGWSHAVSQTDWELEPGQQATVKVTVTAIGGGSDRLLSRLILAPEGGDSEVHEFETTMHTASVQGGEGAGANLALWGGLAGAVAAVGAAAGGAVWFVRRRA